MKEIKNRIYVIEKRNKAYFLLKVLSRNDVSEVKFKDLTFRLDPVSTFFIRGNIHCYVVDTEGRQFTFEDCKQIQIPPSALQDIFEAKILNRLVHSAVSLKKSQIIVYILVFVMGFAIGFLLCKTLSQPAEVIPV